MTFPSAILQSHTAVVGKTGSGKTSTAKLIVEQLVASGARVCILDPIKSDWWGLTSSADGRKPGLAFHILGGPRGHVPLHAAAGKAIGEVVATGALPLSIIDMREFMPGQPTKFFCDFAQSLTRHVRGVLHLVIEEAHVFAPKENPSFGGETQSIHYASKLATAGRSMGVRLIVCTQRTQKLHNDVLGSCETVIAHRLTLPADQKPIVEWLKGNTDKATTETVAGSLPSLKTGEGWICSGEAQILERRTFPRIKTYDNSATPTADKAALDVRTAPVDADRLRSIIGDAVKEAEANDPKLLRARIVELERAAAKAASAAPTGVDQAAVRAAVESAQELRDQHWWGIITEMQHHLSGVAASLRDYSGRIDKAWDASEKTGREGYPLERIPAPKPNGRAKPAPTAKPTPPPRTIAPRPPADASPNGAPSGGLRRMMIALAQRPSGLTKSQLGARACVAVNGGSFRTYLSRGRQAGWITTNEPMQITDDGLAALGDYDPLPVGADLVDFWANELGGGAAKMLRVLVDAYPKSLTKDELGERSGIAVAGGSFRTYLSRLRTLELIEGKSDLRASEELVA